MHSRIILFFLALLVANTHASTSDCTPSQIHISFGDSYYLASAPNNSELNSSQVNNNQAYLVWQSQSECQYFVTVNDTQSQNQISSEIYGLTQTIDNQTSTTNLFSYTILLNNLSYGTSYSYAILDQNNVSLAGPFQFNLASPNITGTSNKIIIAGNLGSQQNNTTTLEAINELLGGNETYAGIIEIGEVPAYLQNGTVAIQSNFTLPNFTETLPLLMTPGQGDMADNLTYFNFRIRNPLFDATQNQYFSFNLQGIHFVSINLDYYNLNTTNQSQVYSWLENDLSAANSTTARGSWPFIVVIASYPLYCTDDSDSASQTADCLSYFGHNDQLNDLFTNSNVDLVISGGLNAYQQLLSTDQDSSSQNSTLTNPNSTIYIIEGVGTSSQSEIRPGFGVIYPQNTSGDLRLMYEHYDSDTGDIVNSVTLVKTNTPVDNTPNPNDNSQNSGDNTSNPANTNTTNNTSNPNNNSQNSTDTANSNTTDNSQNSTTTDDGLIGPTENPDASDPEGSESIVPRLIIPFIIILAIVLVAIYWKRRRQDPEMETLTAEEYKSNKIYNKRSTNASISMVDLVL